MMSTYLEPTWMNFSMLFFALCIALELGVKHLTNKSDIDVKMAASDLACGVLSLLGQMLFLPLVAAVYEKVYHNYALFHFDQSNVASWLLCYLLTDFFYYWWHRAHHVINILWAIHVVHHQGKNFDLFLALRQPLFEPLTIGIFFLPLALLGFGLPAFVICYFFNLLYQFLQHTTLIGSLGVWEYLFVTPSQHRVHHGRQTQYIDKNFGGTFCIWDRLFGSFEKEKQKPSYGIVSGKVDYHPVKANFSHFIQVFTASEKLSFREKLLIWIKNPDYKPMKKSEPMPDSFISWKKDTNPD